MPPPPSTTASAERQKCTVLILMAGPKFDLEWEFGVRLKGLSAFSRGMLITSGSSEATLEIGEFTVHTTLHEPQRIGARLLARWRFFARCWSTARALRRQRQNVDIVVSYDPLFTGLVAWLVASYLRARLVCEVNGDYADPANFLHVGRPLVRTVKQRLAGVICRYVLSRAAGIRVLFTGQLGGLRFSPRPGQVVMQAPEFVNTSAFRNLGEEPRVLLVGFPFFVKGVDIAIAAFKQISDDFPDWSLEIIGYYPDTRQLADAIGGCDRIIHREPVRHRSMNEYIGRCGILIQPSRTESMGRVLVEAMAAEKPRIATNVGGIPTVIEDGVDGVLIDAADVDALVRALTSLISDPALRRRLGMAGSRRAETEFAPSRYFHRTEQLFSAVLSASGPV